MLIVACNPSGYAEPVSEAADPLTLWKEGHCEVVDGTRLQKAFMVYLSQQSPPGDLVKERAKKLKEASDLLKYKKCSTENLARAYALLQQLAADPLDQGRCRQLLDAVVRCSTVLSGNQSPSPSEAMLRSQQEILSWNARIGWRSTETKKKLAEVNQEIRSEMLGEESSGYQAKLVMQALALRYLEQGDDAEAILTARFYRSMYKDQEDPLLLGPEEARRIAPLGSKPTMETIQNLANQSLMALNEELENCTTLMEHRAVKTAAKTLASAFAQSPHALHVISYPPVFKEQMLDELEKEQKFRSLVEDGDLEQALLVLKLLENGSTDFESAPLRGSIESAKALSGIHLDTAHRAELSGHTDEMLRELREAAKYWPKNPAIADFSKEISRNEEIQRKTVGEFDQLVADRRILEIAQQKTRFEQVLSSLPSRQDELARMLEDAQKIEETSEEIERLRSRGSLIGAWELSEVLRRQYPDQETVKSLHLRMQNGVEELARGLELARKREQTQPAVALALYLGLQHRYPKSHFAEEGVVRLSGILLEKWEELP